MIVISNFLEASMIIKYIISVLEHLCEFKNLFMDRRAPKVVQWAVFGPFLCKKCIFRPPESPEMRYLFVFCGFTSQAQHNRSFKKF